MKKRKLLLLLVLLLCGTGGCGKNEEDADRMAGMQIQEESKDAAGEETAGSELSDGEAFSEDGAGVYLENGKPIENVITEQSFEVELDGWGKVTFVSAAPADNKGAPHFVLAKDGTAVYAFPEYDSPKTDDFVEVSAVSFVDYNEDGKQDVIVLVRYRNGGDLWTEAQIFLQENSDNMFYMDYPDMESYRKGAPTDQGPAFYRDSFLEEYLLTQKLTDAVSSVKGTWADYLDYADSMHGNISVDRQLAILAEKRDIWVVPTEYAEEKCCFTITDLDYDGQLEVITASQGGTGRYTYSRFYETDRDGNLQELETFFYGGDSQPDIMEEQMTVYSSFSPEGVRDYYIVYDEFRAAPDCYVYRISSLYMVNDSVIETPLATQTVTYEGENHTRHTAATDCNGNTLTEEEFQSFAETYYSRMELRKMTVALQWTEMRELAGKSDDEVLELLRQTRQGFRREVESAGM